MSLLSAASKERLKAIHKRSRSTWLVVTRGEETLPAQLVNVRRISQRTMDPGEPISVGGAFMQVGGELDGDDQLDLMEGDTFPYDGCVWRTVEPATAGDESVARRALAALV